MLVPFKCEELYTAILNDCKRNQNDIESKIHVLFRSGLVGFDESKKLNQLLTNQEVVCFKRNEGLAMVGRDPIRCMVRSDYAGPERRAVKSQAG